MVYGLWLNAKIIQNIQNIQIIQNIQNIQIIQNYQSLHHQKRSPT